MLRAVAALLVAALTSSSVAAATCAGWEASPAERMACCERAGHDCPDQAAADSCCAGQEQTQQPATTLSTTAMTAPIALVAIVSSALELSALGNSVSRHDAVFAAPQLHAPPGSFELPLRI